MIRDELLGNDSPDGDTEQGPGSSSSTDEDAGDHSDEKKVQDDDDDSEQRLSESSIAHSLRHIALAFDEKVSIGTVSNEYRIDASADQSYVIICLHS